MLTKHKIHEKFATIYFIIKILAILYKFAVQAVP